MRSLVGIPPRPPDVQRTQGWIPRVLERWDKTAKVTYDRRVMNELASLRFVENRRNVVILGPVGVGKKSPQSTRGRREQHAADDGPDVGALGASGLDPDAKLWHLIL
jgi:hypothetical protein